MKQIHLNLLLLLIPVFAEAQISINGKVADSRGQSLPGVNVYIKDTYDGGTTDASGKFKFTTNENGTISILASLIGFESAQQQVKTEGKTITLNFKLNEKVNELNVVTISAGSIEASDTKKAVILRPLDIVTTAGANGDIYGALQTLPGSQPIGETEGMFVRGGAGTEAKTIIDGLPVAHPYQSSVPDIAQRGRFSPFLFKETVFSTGGYSAEYGQAMSSALILNTNDIPDATSTNIGVSSVGFSGGHNHRWEKTSLGVDANYVNLTPYYKIVPQNVDWDKAPQAGGGDIIFRQKTSQTGLLKVYAGQSFSNVSVLYPNVDAPGNHDKFELTNSLTFITASYREILNKSWSVFAATSYSYNNDKRYITPFYYKKIDISSSDNSKQEKIAFTRALGPLSKIKFGTEIQQNSFTNGYFQTTKTYYDSLKKTLDDHYYAGFAETDIYLTHSLVARAGVRSEYSKLIDKMNTAPRLSMAYKTGAESQVSVAYGRFYQTPGNYYIGLATSKPSFEQASHYILNYQKINDNRTFRVEAYYKQYDNLIKTTPRINNNGNGYAKGIDVFYRDKGIIKYMDFWLSYSYLDTRRNYLDYPTAATPVFAAKHTFSAVFKRNFQLFNHYMGFNTTYTYATGRPYYNPTNPEFLTDYTKDYHNLSMSASYLTSIAGNFTVIVLSCSNILGINNIFGYRYSNIPPYLNRTELVAPAPRAIFVGMFITIGGKQINNDKL